MTPNQPKSEQFGCMGILRDAHGASLIVAIQGLVGGPSNIIKLKYYSINFKE